MTNANPDKAALNMPIVLSYIQSQELFEARREGRHIARTSLDLGRGVADVLLEAEEVLLDQAHRLSWRVVEEIVAQAPICFEVKSNAACKIYRFSTLLNRPYSLMATTGAPTLLNSGFTMHRIVGIDPIEDTRRKIRALGVLAGPVLDTATGLGYTAIEAARQGAQVTTVEIDLLVLEIARLNPWSRELFDNERITQQIGDIGDVIERFPDRHFASIMHDPPTVSLAGNLYGATFYRQLFRVLGRGGVLFHYVGNLESKQGSTVTRGAVRRLREAGFTRVEPRPQAFGIVARKA